MSGRYSRPRTPPGPPPGHSSRKSSSRGPSTSAASSSSKPLLAKSFNERSYDSYDKAYAKPSSSSYSSSKAYTDEKYKSSSARKVSEKVGNSKYSSKGDGYREDGAYKARQVSFPGSRYSEKEGLFLSGYPEKGRYDDKYAKSSTYVDKYSAKKYADGYEAYGESSGRYPRLDSDGYFGGSASSYSPYTSYGSYGSERPSIYDPAAKTSLAGSHYGGRESGARFGADRLGLPGYGALDRLDDRGGYQGADKLGRGRSSAYLEDKTSSTRAARGFGSADHRTYRDYSPPRLSRSSVKGLGRGSNSSSSTQYGRYTPPPLSRHSPEPQYLDRYVIGDSVVYGSPGHYPGDLRSSSPVPRPPSPPSPQPLLPRSYTNYSSTSPKLSTRYTTSSSRNRKLSSAAQSTSYEPSSARRITSPRRPPSPVTKRPPSPRSPYVRGRTAGSSRERSYDRARSKDSSQVKGREVRRPRSPHSPQPATPTPLVREYRREDSRERSRRMEDRLGPTSRRSPLVRPRLSRKTTPPRDNRSRRTDDLRLLIESRKTEGGKRPLSPSSRVRPAAKRAARSSDRSRLADSKKRLGGRRTVPPKRNKILKKYQRLSAKKRGGRSGGAKSSRENGRKSEGDPGKPGSSATIHRVIKKPKNVSHVNRLALKPRVIRRPTQKLLKDPKETDKGKESGGGGSQSAKDESVQVKEEPTSPSEESKQSIRVKQE